MRLPLHQRKFLHGLINLVYVPTASQLADILTKGLTGSTSHHWQVGCFASFYTLQLEGAYTELINRIDSFHVCYVSVVCYFFVTFETAVIYPCHHIMFIENLYK